MEIPKSMVEAGARAIMNSEAGIPGDWWSGANEGSKNAYRAAATACLRAAMVGVEVVGTNSGARYEFPTLVGFVGLNDGDTLAVIRGGV